MNRIVLLLLLILNLAVLPAISAPNHAPLPDASSVIQFQGNQDSIDNNVDEAIEKSTKEVVTPHVEDVKVMTPNSNDEVKKIVLKDTNESLKFTITKFLGAMLGVVISSVLIFLILLVMNKINKMAGTGGLGFPKDMNDENNPFKGDAPSTAENEALRTFLDKTK